MDANLESLINKIKTEGIEEAEKNANQIIQEAEEQADKLLKEARKEADEIIENGRQKAQQLQETGEEALRQAQRDTILVTRERITEILDQLFQNRLKQALTPEFLQEIITRIVEQLDSDGDYQISVPEADLDKLSQLLLNETAEELADGNLELIPEKELKAGIRIKLEDEDLYYDISDEGISRYLNQFLNPAVQKILEETE